MGATVMHMRDPLSPTLMTRLRAKIGGQRDAAVLEVMRRAGKAAYDERLKADQVRSELIAAGASPWTVPVGTSSQLVAAWNAFVLQSLGESLLDADYGADPGTVGFVPAVTFTQAEAWLSAVEGWVSLARQARSNPDFDLTEEYPLPADLPEWPDVHPCPAEHIQALLTVVPTLREDVDVTLFGLERAGVPQGRRVAFNRLKQLAAEAASAADYALALGTRQPHPGLQTLVEDRLRLALELWFQAGQLAAMPRLLTGAHLPEPPAARRIAPPPAEFLPGGETFDPWCLTDPATVGRWRSDPKARRALTEMWKFDPDPAATMALKAEIDRALDSGAIDRIRVRGNGTCYYECPWPSLYEALRQVRIGGRRLVPRQQFTLELGFRDGDRGTAFRRRVIVGPFHSTDEVEYGS
jgi:hypothetical protein